MNAVINETETPLGIARQDLLAVEQRLPLSGLMKAIGLGDYAKPQCKSPFRSDSNPSFGVFTGDDGRERFKDSGCEEHRGDGIDLLALRLGIDPKMHLPALLGLYKSIADHTTTNPPAKNRPAVQNDDSEPRKPSLPNMRMGTEDELTQLAELRGYSLEALKWAQERGVLRFVEWCGSPVYALTDASGLIIEVRRLDGEWFPEYGPLPDRKSHAMRGSTKAHILGLPETADYRGVLLVEGVTDFLAGHSLIYEEQVEDGDVDAVEWAPAAILSAGIDIPESELPEFEGKNVVIVPDLDPKGQGTSAAMEWQEQLKTAGATVQILDLSVVRARGHDIKDLNEFIRIPREDLEEDFPGIFPILPRKGGEQQ